MADLDSYLWPQRRSCKGTDSKTSSVCHSYSITRPSLPFIALHYEQSLKKRLQSAGIS